MLMASHYVTDTEIDVDMNVKISKWGFYESLGKGDSNYRAPKLKI